MKISERETKQWLALAQEAVLRAGRLLSKSKKNTGKILKECGRDIKVAGDLASEEIIIDYLYKHSCFSILSEERGLIDRKESDFVWIIDPLDGSFNYTRGLPLCCVSVGLWYKKQPIVGVVYDFFRSELYTGIVGSGAWLNNKKIAPSSISKKDKAVLCTGFPIKTDFCSKNLTAFIKEIQIYKKIRMLGSAALSLVYVASGKTDVYAENNIMIWDVAGGLAVAGGSGCTYRIKDGTHLNSLDVVVWNGNFKI